MQHWLWAALFALASFDAESASPVFSPYDRHFAVEQLTKIGLSNLEARSYASTLIDWLEVEERVDNESLIQALAALSSMLHQGVLTPEDMSSFCEVAKDCIANLAAGSGLSAGEVQKHIDARHWLTKNALGKMFAVARNRYLVKAMKRRNAD